MTEVDHGRRKLRDSEAVDDEFEDEDDDGDGWCYECGEEFHLDDTGGYNPPCPCGCGRCRDCCRAEAREDDEWFDEGEGSDGR